MVLSIFPFQCPHFKCCQADLRHLPASSGERVCAPDGLDALSPGRAAPSMASCTPASSMSVLKGHPRPALCAAPAPAGCPRCSAQEGREAGQQGPPRLQGAGGPWTVCSGRVPWQAHTASSGAGAAERVYRSRDAAFPGTPARLGPNSHAEVRRAWPGTVVNKALWLLLCGGNTTLSASVVCSRRDAKASESGCLP